MTEATRRQRSDGLPCAAGVDAALPAYARRRRGAATRGLHALVAIGARGTVRAVLVLGALFFPAEASVAQTLALDGVPEGPSLRADCGAVEVARLLDSEALALRNEAKALTAEAKSSAEAKARVRTLAGYLLQTGATMPWERSAATVLGARLSMLAPRIDRLIDSSLAGVNPRTGNPLTPAEMRAAADAIAELSQLELDGVRRAVADEGPDAGERLVVALGATLAPLRGLVRAAEGVELPDPWPVVADARDASLERVDDTVSAEELQQAIGVLGTAELRTTFETAAARVGERVDAAQRASDRRNLEAAAGAAKWLEELLEARPPRPAPEDALRAAQTRIATAVEGLGSAEPATAQQSRTALAALDDALTAAQLLAQWRRDPAASDAARKQLSNAIGALLAAELPPNTDERLRARAARRITEACRSATRLREATKGSTPPDLRDALRQFDRKARIAEDALPEAIERVAVDPSAIADPSVASTFDRIRGLEADRLRVVALQRTIDRIASIRPAAAEGFARQARRMTRMLVDDGTRGNAVEAFSSLERQCAQVFPFPYEEQLKQRTERAQALTGGHAAKIASLAGTARAEWASALAAADFSGPAAQRLDRIARLCAALSDLDSVESPIQREQGDRLALWGGWASRRANLAPASRDLPALAMLASRSLVSAHDAASWSSFERDLMQLERAIPLVRLAARLEQRLTPILRGDPASLGAAMAPIVTVPASDAYLVAEWNRLLAVDRGLLELEHARRKDDRTLRLELEEYLARLAQDIQDAAFGAAKPIGAVRGFDGTEAEPAKDAAAGRTSGKASDKSSNRTSNRTSSKTSSKISSSTSSTTSGNTSGNTSGTTPSMPPQGS